MIEIPSVIFYLVSAFIGFLVTLLLTNNDKPYVVIFIAMSLSIAFLFKGVDELRLDSEVSTSDYPQAWAYLASIADDIVFAVIDDGVITNREYKVIRTEFNKAKGRELIK